MNKSWALVLISVLSLSVGWHSVWAQTQPRLFLTPEQRQMIEQGRQGKPSTPQGDAKALAMETTSISVSPKPETAVGLEAVIITPKGQRLARINGRFENISSQTDHARLTSSAPLAMLVEQGVRLRVGERYRPKTGEVESMHTSKVPRWAHSQQAPEDIVGTSSSAQMHSLLPKTLAAQPKKSQTQAQADAD